MDRNKKKKGKKNCGEKIKAGILNEAGKLSYRRSKQKRLAVVWIKGRSVKGKKKESC